MSNASVNSEEENMGILQHATNAHNPTALWEEHFYIMVL